MEVVVTSEEMRACDRYAIKRLRISGPLLMENAGRGVAESIRAHFSPLAGKSVYIFCGKGNNGGDGFVVARHLINMHCDVKVLLVGKGSQLKGDAKANYQILKSILKWLPKQSGFCLIESVTQSKLRVLPAPDILVDALFGTGFYGNVKEPYVSVMHRMNDWKSNKVSIDVPSGLNADNGAIGNIAVKVDVTITMGFKKIGLITGNGTSYAGQVEVADIGAPFITVRDSPSSTWIIGREDVRGVLPSRPVDAHKHSVGKILVVAGSRGLTGAAAMTTTAAMKAGAGAVILCAPDSIYTILGKKLTEVMVEPHPETSEGTLNSEAYQSIERHFPWADILIIGPGLSRNAETAELILKIVSEFRKPMLIDADALNAWSAKKATPKYRRSPDVIITPHTGELARLIRRSSAEIDLNRVAIARETAQKFALTVLLKGAPTVVASPDGKVFINSTGNPGMATAGSGDVLAGLLGGLWGQGMGSSEAAYAGAYVHGLAGDLAKKKYGEKGLMATDIQEFVPQAMAQIEGLKSL